MGYLGFDHYEGGCKLYRVTHKRGSDFVHAPNEMLAMQRYMAKYPDREIRKIEEV